jgi:ribosomal protein S27AE
MTPTETQETADLSADEAVRTCARCKIEKPLSDFARDHRKKFGRAYACRACEANRKKEYFARPELMRRQALWARNKYAQDPTVGRSRRSLYRATHEEKPVSIRSLKESARRELRQAVRDGRITKPDQCSSCGSASVIHGHHHDYSRPLDVEWLCGSCHAIRHRKY